MTFTWWLLPIISLGIGLVFAPALGKLWADRDERRRRSSEQERYSRQRIAARSQR